MISPSHHLHRRCISTIACADPFLGMYRTTGTYKLADTYVQYVYVCDV